MIRPARPYRVFVVDDSRTIRRLISAIVDETEGLVLAGSAESAEEAWDVLRQPGFEVDVVSLDIELPGINGIEFLKQLMAKRPIPVLVVSGHTDSAADLTLTALENGAIDCIQKPDGRPTEIDRFLRDTGAGLLRAAQSSLRARAPAAAPPANPILPPRPNAAASAASAAGFNGDNLICIGASTGGVPAVCKVVEGLRGVNCPIVVVQHMPASFTPRLATRLAQTTGLPAFEATDGGKLTPRTIWVAPGGRHLHIVRKPGGYFAKLTDENPVSGHKPSIDVMFHSAAQEAGGLASGILLTGMGRDGADGLLAMRNAGAHTIAQDEATCVVYGMPKSAVAMGAVDQVLPLDRIADHILSGAPRVRTSRHAGA
ncbi:chemotaxis response regulator protein-glutamate methylesterase of group 1 operon [Alsobacter metallidurans]|uniref:Protein-glutamate methylesterase/protein-glutamine glutaminase n=1 Tax=Alsobacter metallidurans TaxID=340221 RepID=A0A917I5H8_9HYPH|nr:chemotaxis-specific protein-glutamate methyltransferase CheB [Alsobacter metallidurans]GGH13329.1 chemotaxis response regulator protein-glutamate methylesterase of group 1 operon [Alsobacter metallidurans]